ncbi:hypothetical protein M422DRAFT_25466 [Sphaerobolus stellatus SS14]|nr:hypothetical protein M422DRAFT_25466 [Sphaerobolus stellatus SS14]
MHIINERMYVFGGQSNQVIEDVLDVLGWNLLYELDLSTRVWCKLSRTVEYNPDSA